MSQFEVYPNPVRVRRDIYPYVVQLQSDLAAANLREVLAAPLVPASLLNGCGSVLLPVVNVGSEAFTLCVPMLGAIPSIRLGQPIGEVREARWSILGAVDRLFTGA